MSGYDVIGLFGVVAYVSSYGLLQTNRLQSSDLCYLFLNALGSVLLIVSLLGNFNLPSFISQTTWMLFTIVGFLRTRARARSPAS